MEKENATRGPQTTRSQARLRKAISGCPVFAASRAHPLHAGMPQDSKTGVQPQTADGSDSSPRGECACHPIGGGGNGKNSPTKTGP